MKQTEAATDLADEAFAAFAETLSQLARDVPGADFEAQLAQLRRILVEGAQLREQAFAGLIGAWRELADLGTSFAAPIAAFHAGDAEGARELEKQATELRHACDALGALLAPLPAEAFAAFATTARARIAERRPFESVKAVYDAWIESSEAAYSRLAHSEAFASAQSRLNQASLRLRAAQLALIEGGARQLGLPTRADVDELHRQIHELRNEIVTLRGKPASARKRVPRRRR
ncbi:MAG TPA: poly(R)-hydroxyalkanoic acid synthase subunit PhaE [Steroidobacteraceae bacterium]|nr:poly(R)-hydroxyalkanoic acid synthase subunit PhaE [Steroidobacteraceae bacterium]